MTSTPGNPSTGQSTRSRLATNFSAGAIRLSRAERRGLPSGPNWPVTMQSLALLTHRHVLLPRLRRRFGSLFTLRILSGNSVVVSSCPRFAGEMFAGDAEVFSGGKSNAILGPVMGARSVLLLDGAQHRDVRTLLMPGFTAAALRGYQELIGQIATEQVGTWTDGETFRALDRMNSLALEVILRVVMGVGEPGRLAELTALVHRMVNIGPATLIGFQVPRLRSVPPWKAFSDLQFRLDELIYRQIAEHRASDLSGRRDLLSVLIREHGEDADDELLRDQLVSLLLAGHETTASALTWCLYEVGRDDVLQERTRRAVLDDDDVWLEAVVKETLRVHSVIANAGRILEKPAQIDAEHYPAGVSIVSSLLLTHLEPGWHPDPERFDPGRFITPDGRRTVPPGNSWIPFGGGSRRCLGAGLSLLEAVQVLRAVLGRYQIHSLRAERPAVRNVTGVPAGGAMVRVSACRTSTSRH